MVKFFCKSCSYRFIARGAGMPRQCPACGSKEDIAKDYDAEMILREVMEEDPI